MAVYPGLDPGSHTSSFPNGAAANFPSVTYNREVAGNAQKINHAGGIAAMKALVSLSD